LINWNTGTLVWRKRQASRKWVSVSHDVSMTGKEPIVRVNTNRRVLCVLCLMGSGASAWGQTPLGTAWTYQGQLKQDGVPLNDTADIEFALYDADLGGALVAGPISASDIAVVNGLFTVELDFGLVFADTALFLEVAVRAPHDPADLSPFTVLDPRQPITPAPVALALRHVRTEATPGAPNVIGGDPGNSVLPGAEGSTIGGGLNNQITGGSSVISGGSDNNVNANQGIVVGGSFNAATGFRAIVVGGHSNSAVGQQSYIGGGINNLVGSVNGTIGGGDGNSIPTNGLAGTIAGGEGGTIGAAYGAIGGGQTHTIRDGATHATIGGGFFHDAFTAYSTVSGGRENCAGGDFNTNAPLIGGENATVGGGRRNIAFAESSTIAGGRLGRVDGVNGTIAGGSSNRVFDDSGAIGGGTNNEAGSDDGVPSSAIGATVAGGQSNIARESGSTVSGGLLNIASGYTSTVSGGNVNIASGDFGAIGGGFVNHASGNGATVSGGNINTASGEYSTVGGGQYNIAAARFATIAGGGPTDDVVASITNNRVYDDYGSIGGGGGNRVGTDNAFTNDAVFSTVSGGSGNSASGSYAAIGGGLTNIASNAVCTVSGGRANIAKGIGSVVGGGGENKARGNYSTVSGGNFNDAVTNYAVVGGGLENHAAAPYATVSGGYGSLATANHSTVAGGRQNWASGYASAISGGDQNVASGSVSTVAGGAKNVASGVSSTVAGGASNLAGGDLSFAAGWRAKVRDAAMVGDSDGDEGTFIWADNTDADFQSTGPNQFLIRASGGVGIGTNNPVRQLHVSGNQGVARIASTNNVFSGSVLELANQTVATDLGLGAINFVDSGGQVPGQIAYLDNELLDDMTLRVGGSERMRITGAGTVEIGTQTSTAAMGLKVEAGSDLGLLSGGFLQLGSAGSANLAFDQNEIMARNNGSGTTLFVNPSAGDVLIGNNNANVRVGIGTNSPGQELEVDGDICASGTIGACSDARFKTNIKPIRHALELATAIRGVRFDWRRADFPKRNFADRPQIGFVAQEVAKVAPEVVMQNDDGYYTVDYGRLTPILLEALKEQQDEIQTLRRQVAEQDARLARVEALLEETATSR
jgi:hypothetical protein